MVNGDEHKKCKVKKKMLLKNQFQDYYNCLFTKNQQLRKNE